MQRPTLALVVFVSLLGVAGSAQADTISFSFVSTPNSSGTYVDASGTVTGTLTYFSNPADLNVLLQNGGTITTVSNIPPSPFVEGKYPLIPELNDSSNISSSNGGFQFNNSPDGIIVTSFGGGAAFYIPGKDFEGGDFYFEIEASGLNGAPGNGEIVATDDGFSFYYVTDGTLTLSGQVGAYDLTPEPPSWLLLGSGVALLGFMFYRRPMAAQHTS
ncbi:MAG TPA: hypothetical protein VK814_18240 [Acidobacteriaceae bacterium]|nr:hypothetical protein [Acidobacteriaceae bacterium]